ncbi:hypothetical protein GUJ93_ZPchr0009g632 [Zizania palustris]|uniref:Amino acid transporter transmembrane domain-containing protein n=1 Tax=Zizania palustris TaxID=103762 RepID=A0A8J5RGM5_ZIZPA|nr:hypothetical protein GUJ93_ZPchr0009g632 [Zizania palustris]
MSRKPVPAMAMDPRFLQRQMTAAAAAAVTDTPEVRGARELRPASERFREQTLELGASACTEASIEQATKNRLGPETPARRPGRETAPRPREGEVVVFEAFFDAGLGFPASELLAGVLEAFHVELPQLSPNAVARLAIFEWAMRAEGCEGRAEVFAEMHEALCQPKKKDGRVLAFGSINFQLRRRYADSFPAKATNERSWGIISLTVAYFWQLYTLWILVKLHEAVPGRRYNRYVELAQAAFGEKLGVWLALFPTIYLSAGTATALILVGGETMKLFYQIVCGPVCSPSPISTVEWYLVFTSLSIVLSQLPNLNSIAGVSLIGGATAITYCTMSWVLSVSEPRSPTISYEPIAYTSFGSSLFSTMNALGIIAFVFRGHNLALEIQATMPSTFKHPAHVPMWRGAKVAYVLIAMCLFPVAIGGYWAYGNMMPSGGMLTAIYAFHSHDIPRGLLAATFLLVVFNCLSSFQIYSMPVFDSFEAYYTGRTNRPCSVWVRSGFRVFYGFISLFIGVALPFLSSLAGLLGGLTLPVTFAYPCFMWICIKKPERFSSGWYLNWGLGLLGTAFSLALSVGGVWSIICTGMKLKFFKPN